MMKILVLFIAYSVLLNAQDLLLLMGDGIGEYPITADLIHSYDEREMAVDGWADQTGTLDFAQLADIPSQPDLNASALNGYSGLTFDGTTDVMYTIAFTLAQPITIYFVAKMISYGEPDFFLTDDSQTFMVREGGGTPKIYMYAGGGTGDPKVNHTVGQYKISGCVYNGASGIYSLNGTDATGNFGAAGFSNDRLLIGGGATAGASDNGNIEIVCLYIHSTAHDLATRTTIINWLNSKYKVF